MFNQEPKIVAEGDTYAGFYLGANILIDIEARELYVKDDLGREVYRCDTGEAGWNMMMIFIKEASQKVTLH